ncbi:MAG: hypothetical protein KJ904_08675 [Alphaproteobacteria bacterium]|nr:hypothetical protein [Alphaproteobacteria bacterium]MBU0798970.1 hypothetical protein [Alphaproteobacteria bacterium]MBU0887225.1 hypothetical protein [Alphaproteobacteria bacterium]MBU1812247.1 hypothetical protein [Alphaproteobacteria bacterium]
MGLLDFVTSILTGGATGLLGMLASAGIRLLEAREKRHTLAIELAHAERLHLLQMEARSAEHENERLIADLGVARDLRVASYDHDRGYGRASLWVVNILRLVRPGLTLMLLGLTAVVFFQLYSDEDRRRIVEMLIYATTAAVIWWFGSRDMEKGK